MSMDTADDMEAMENRLGQLRYFAEIAREAIDESEWRRVVGDLITFALMPFERPTCTDGQCERFEDGTSTCGGYHSAETEAMYAEIYGVQS